MLDKKKRKGFLIACLVSTAVVLTGLSLSAQGTPVKQAKDKDLVAYWNFNEGSGDIAKDSSGNNDDAEVSGAGWAKGIEGYALEFDGAKNYVNCGTDPTLDITEAITLEAWIKTSVLQGKGIIAKYNSPGNGSYLLTTREDLQIRFTIVLSDGTTVNMFRSFVYDDDKWHHLVATYDGSSMKIYGDGVLLGIPQNQKGEIKVTTHKLTIGNYSSLAYPFNGFIDDVRIYKRALGADEIKAGYETKAGVRISGPKPKIASPSVYTGKSLKFIQISDSHIRTQDTTKILFTAAEEIKKSSFKPDFIIFTGDNVDEPQEEFFINFKNALSAFPVPVYTLMGNHDFSPSLYEKFLGRRNYSFNCKGYHIIVMDSNGKTQDILEDEAFYLKDSDRTKENLIEGVNKTCNGLFRKETLEWLGKDLKNISSDTPVLIFSHHCFGGERRIGLIQQAVANPEAIFNLLKGYSVIASFSGHAHRNAEYSYKEIEFLVSPCLSVIRKNDDGTPVGYREIEVIGNEIKSDYKIVTPP